jgi:predicted TIM-barrel fold metal-dependent hydrolase
MIDEPTTDNDSDLPSMETLLIDADVHESLRSTQELLSPHWQHYITQYGFSYTFWDPLPYATVMAPGLWVQEAKSDPKFEGTWSYLAPGTDFELLTDNLFTGEQVTHAILNGLYHVSENQGHYEFMTALASAYNDWQIATWLDREPRLYGSIHVVANDPAAAAREIDRLGDRPQMVQVFLPLDNDWEYGDPIYRPIFAAAARHQLAIALHEGSSTRTALGYPRYYIQWHTLGPPQVGMSQLVSILCNGVFDEFPELKLILLETSVAWVPWLMWRLDEQYKEVRHEIPWVKQLPSEHLQSHVRLSTQPMSDVKPEHFAKLVEMSESSRMFMFATDYPHYDADSVGNVLTSALPAVLHRRIRYENALETYPKIARGAARRSRIPQPPRET